MRQPAAQLPGQQLHPPPTVQLQVWGARLSSASGCRQAVHKIMRCAVLASGAGCRRLVAEASQSSVACATSCIHGLKCIAGVPDCLRSNASTRFFCSGHRHRQQHTCSQLIVVSVFVSGGGPRVGRGCGRAFAPGPPAGRHHRRRHHLRGAALPGAAGHAAVPGGAPYAHLSGVTAAGCAPLHVDPDFCRKLSLCLAS